MEAASWSEEEIVPVFQADNLPSDGPPTKAMRLDKLSEGTSVTHHQAMKFQIPHEENTRRKKLGLTFHEYEPPPLPVDWVAINHCSGGIAYLHKPTRVCTWSRPYQVSGSMTIKKHRVPVQAVPCLEKWLFQEERCQLADQWHQTAGGRKGLLIKLEPQNLREYLSQRWEIVEEGEEESVLVEEGLSVPRKKHTKTQQKKEQLKSLVPDDLSKVLHIPIPKQYRQYQEPEGKKPPAVWLVNISNKSAVSLLYEFCQNYLKTSPEFVIEETNNRVTPYSCTVMIGDMKYGHKMAATKKKAKHSAAEETLDLFLPKVFESKEQQSTSEDEFQYLSSIEIEDPQAAQVLQQVGKPTPWHVLKECHQRNQDIPGYSGELQFTLGPKDSSCDGKYSFEYCLSLGQHTVKGLCMGKKDGQQIAAQAMLKKLHPFIMNWGALLRIYDDRHSANLESQDLRDKSSCSGIDADHSLLKQLKEEMQKLAADQSPSTAADARGLLQM